MKKVLTAWMIASMLVLSGCGGHASGYGNTSKCTICGKPATHHSTNYGYCDQHWKDATKSK